ncbi:phenylacetate--CoA ligase family protein [Exiguobacterium sp. s80]|uniref:phenylacetate--CoA ligase family protein n=1 Tax=Exiguobacterium sp. s80 TaxID=2751209 RepID=UPI001BE57EFE|nr:hypothetical protein [Exiguobacterium sp. s80]
MLRKLIYEIGMNKYNNQIKEEYLNLKKMENYTLEDLKEYQFKELKKLLKYAYNNSSFYKRQFNKKGVLPSDLNNIKDLEKFPFLTKENLRNESNDISNTSDSRYGKMYYSETSGSTGEPLIFFRNQKWDAVHRASILRGYSWHGIKPYQKNGYLWGYNLNGKKAVKTKFFDVLQNRTRIFSYKEEELDKFLLKMQSATYIEGYSSMIYELAKKVNSKDKSHYKFPKMKMIKGTSEKIFDNYKKEVKKAFGLNFVSEYGAAEAGIIAFECPFGNMHITMENIIVESVDNEIVVTNLSSYSFPIIRYKLGDYIELESESYRCKCGKSHPIIKSILGRVGNLILGKKDKYPSLTLYYVFKNLAEKGHKLYYQAIQEQSGVLKLNIEQKLSENQRIILDKELYKYFENDLEVLIFEKTNIDRGDGKMRDFISYL